MTAPATPPPRADPLPIEPLPAPPDAEVTVPGSKSLTNRALIAALLADGTSIIDGALFADDTEAMLDALRALGARVETHPAAARMVIDGTGGSLLPAARIDARQSGTTARFVAPVLCLGSGPYQLDGDPQLRARPMGHLFEALRTLGAEVSGDTSTHLPVEVHPRGFSGGRVAVRGDLSSQFLSGLLLAGPCVPGGLTVTVAGPLVSAPFVELTVAVVEAFGGRVERPDPTTFVVSDTGYQATRYLVEPDASAASYFFAAAAVTGGRVRVLGLGERALQGDLRFVDVLAELGCDVERDRHGIAVAGGELRGVDVDLRDVPDTAPTLAIVAARASGTSRFGGIGFIRHHETDRLAAIVRELRRCGVEAHEHDDGFTVVGGAAHGAVVQTYRDHRMAMAFAVLGLVVPGIEISDPGCVAKTFPDFFDRLDALRPPVTGPAPV